MKEKNFDFYSIQNRCAFSKNMLYTVAIFPTREEAIECAQKYPDRHYYIIGQYWGEYEDADYAKLDRHILY